MADVSTIVIKGETSGVRQATADLDKFERATKDVTDATDKLGRESKETANAVGKTAQSASQATTRTKALGEAKTQAAMAAQNYASRLGPIGGLLSAIGPAGLAAAAAIGGIGVAMTKSIAVANQFDKINAALRIATGSAKGAQKEFDFLATNASKLGIDLQSSALQFARFSAAAKGTALEGQAARDIFIGISQASVALGLSSDEASRAFIAIQQSASKGKVSAEELRQQLGEAIPRAVPLLAEAMGISVAALDKMLERGEVGVDKLALLGKAFQDFYGPEAQRMAEQYQGSVAALGNELDLLFNVIGQGAQDATSPILRALADAVRVVREELEESASGGLTGALTRFIQVANNPVQSAAFAAGAAIGDTGEKAAHTAEMVGGLNYTLNQSAADFLATGQTSVDFAGAILGVSDAATETADSLVIANEKTSEAQDKFVRLIAPMEETGRLFRALETGGVAAMEAVADEIERHNEVAAIANQLIKDEGFRRERATAAAEAHITRLERINAANEDAAETERALKEARAAAEKEREEQAAAEQKRAEDYKAQREKELAEEQARLEKEAEARRRAFIEPILEAGRAIQRNLADAFREVFDGNIKGFRDFFDAVVDIAKNAAAQIAAAFVTQNILSFASGGGGVSVGQAIQIAQGALPAGGTGGAGGAGGGAGTLASVAGLFGSGGMGTGLSGAGLGSGFMGVGGLFAPGGAFGAGGGGLAQVFGMGSQVGIPGAPGSGFVTSGLGTAVNMAGVAALGAGGGVLLADLLGNQSATGGAIGGGAGAAIGFAVGGPLGALIGGALGGSLGGLIGGKEDKGSFALQTGGSGFTGGVTAQSAFGNIGLGRGTESIGGDLAQTLLGAVAQADQLVASALTEQQIADVRNALQGSGQLVRTGRGNKYFEQAFGKAIADRFLTIFDALGIAAPSGLTALARADGTAGTATAQDVLGIALPSLAANLDLGETDQTSVVDQLASASGPSSDLLGNIGTEIVVGNQLQETGNQTLRQIRDAIDDLTAEVRRTGAPEVTT